MLLNVARNITIHSTRRLDSILFIVLPSVYLVCCALGAG
ncbi:MAG: hypothetical protein QOH25_2250 [Acidobacteriota bacterium]|jgi:hypothetical protein|nr:hypothetical protein [Acidobacteriota bacterium]